MMVYQPPSDTQVGASGLLEIPSAAVEPGRETFADFVLGVAIDELGYSGPRPSIGWYQPMAAAGEWPWRSWPHMGADVQGFVEHAPDPRRIWLNANLRDGHLIGVIAHELEHVAQIATYGAAVPNERMEVGAELALGYMVARWREGWRTT